MQNLPKLPGQFFWQMVYKFVVGPGDVWWFEMHLHGVCLYNSMHDELYAESEEKIKQLAHSHHCGRASVLGLKPEALAALWMTQDRRDVPSLVMADGSIRIVEPS